MLHFYKIYRIFLLWLLVFSFLNVWAQHSFTLDECIEYALEHHIQIKQSAVQKEQALLNVKQSKLNLLPRAQATIGNGLQGGNTVSADNTGFVTQIQSYGNISLQASVEVFNFFNKRNTMLANPQHH